MVLINLSFLGISQDSPRGSNSNMRYFSASFELENPHSSCDYRVGIFGT